MADQPVIHIGENSPEQVAFKLMERIANAEGRNLYSEGSATRAWILQTYYDCMMTVRMQKPETDRLNRKP